MKRIPEPELMDDELEAESYASEATRYYLGRIDDTFVTHYLRIGPTVGFLLDLGTGPGVIPLKIAARCSGLNMIGVDLSKTMLKLAQNNLKEAGLKDRVRFEEGDAKSLEYPDDSFDAVISNSLLHHLQDPLVVIQEALRVLKPHGALLIRDIRRPPASLHWLWVRLFGRYYEGRMLSAYARSLRAALNFSELKSLIEAISFRQVRPFRHGLTHIGLEKRAMKD
jgi:ubiquinone/menaquinone biosynthesis C-methylase UbiE